MSLDDAIARFGDEDAAIALVARLRWPDGPTCPRCGCGDHAYLAARRLWKCRACAHQYSVKAGTLFEGSPLGLSRWLPAVWAVANDQHDQLARAGATAGHHAEVGLADAAADPAGDAAWSEAQPAARRRSSSAFETFSSSCVSASNRANSTSCGAPLRRPRGRAATPGRGGPRRRRFPGCRRLPQRPGAHQAEEPGQRCLAVVVVLQRGGDQGQTAGLLVGRARLKRRPACDQHRAQAGR